MEVYIKKYFWALSVAVVIVCSVFTAKAVNHYVEAKFLADPEEARKPAPAKSAAAADQKSKAGESIAARNMFCHSCLPPEPVVGAAMPADGSVPLTSLPLRLVATNVSTIEAESFATVLNTTSNKQGSYWMDGEIPGAGKIVKIRGKYVDFQNMSANRVERISLLNSASPAPTPAVASTSAAPAGTSEKDELLAAVDEGVKKIDDTTYEIERSVVDKVLANPTAVGRSARIVPSIKNGKPNGFKLYAIRPSSVYSKIGLMNGDTIHAVNGFDLTTPDKALEVYTKVREANNLSVTATRRGKPITLNYTIK
jgi:general secretion pathway protein C